MRAIFSRCPERIRCAQVNKAYIYFNGTHRATNQLIYFQACLIVPVPYITVPFICFIFSLVIYVFEIVATFIFIRLTNS